MTIQPSSSRFGSLPGWLISVTAAALLLAGEDALARNDAVTFSRGAIIIPEQASFQTPCGAISAYGLVWKILQSNQPGHFNETHPVTVYMALNGNKVSHNRCVISNRTRAPDPNSVGPSGASNHWDDVSWNDGCDVQIVNNSEQPIVPVNYTSAWPASGVYSDAAISTIDTTDSSYTYSTWYDSPTAVARPGQSTSTTLDNSGTLPNRFTTVQYMGGPFVIDAPDAQNVMNFLRSGDSFASASELSQFTTPCTCSTSYGATPSPTCHYVVMHQATHNFTAPVGRRFNQIPAKIALLDTGAGVQYYPHTTTPLRVLDGYLQNAGLYRVGTSDSTDSGGCPAGTTSGCTLNGGRPGVIYDQFNSYSDLVSTGSFPQGLLNAVDSSGKLIYRVFWTPHWDVSDSIASRTYTGGDCTTPGQPQCQGSSNYTTIAPWPPVPDPRRSAMDNVSIFLDNRGTGLMAECSAIENYEGSNTGGTPVTPISPNTNFLFTGPIAKNAVGANFDGRNCTDPDYLAMGGTRPNCVVYQQIASPFAQIGDYHFVAQGGFVSSFGINTASGSNYRPGVARLLVSWTNFTSGTSVNVPPSGVNGWDFFDFGFKMNDTRKGAIIYVGGHEQLQSTAGNRLILNTLLNLNYNFTGTERALSAPIAFVDNNPGTSDAAGTKSLLFAGTYVAITGYPGAPSYSTFMFDQGSHWNYPYTPGHFRTHSLIGGSTLVVGENSLDAFSLWDASDVLNATAPASRNIFTYFGGRVATGQPGPHGVRQIGWVPEIVSGVALPSGCPAPAGQCVDVMKYAPSSTGNLIQLVPGSDGICDIQQALNFTSINSSTDMSGSCTATNRQNLLADLPKVTSLLQVVRGYCFATVSGNDGPGETPLLTPSTSTQCNSSWASPRPVFGGVVHSTPAIVAPSTNIDLGPAKRPTVAYVGGYDGQLRAIYVSGGSRYTGPSTTVSLPPSNLPANSPRMGAPGGNVFSTDWASQFAAGTTPPAGTELWSFIPASQLAGLAGNNARVDSSPVYMDVFVDLTGSGLREWHTILAFTIGTTGNELVCFDISNPLKPVILWDIVGSSFQWGPGYPQVPGTTLQNASTGGTFDIQWVEPTAYFRFPPSADPGRTFTGLYDYSALGGSVGLSVGQLRAGLQPVYAIYAATNAAVPTAGGLGKGLEVFAIDIATGQKIWQWEEPYTQTWVPNAVPPVVSLITGVDGVQRLYVGDAEGRIWELDAGTGVNFNNANDICASPPCNYPAFDTHSTAANPQPITTNIAIAMVPRNPDVGSAFYNYPGATMLLYGTAGANWVPATVSGSIHGAFQDMRYRVPYRTGGTSLDGMTTWTVTGAQAFAAANGVLQERSPGLPHAFVAGERLWGAITVAGVKAYFGTAIGPVPNDIMLISARTLGATYFLDFQSATSSSPITQLVGPSYANYGGITVFQNASTGNTDIIGLEISKLSKSVDTTTHSAPNPALSPTGQRGLIYYLKTWMQRFLN